MLDKFSKKELQRLGCTEEEIELVMKYHLYDKVFLDTIRFTDYKLEFTDKEVFFFFNGKFDIELVQFNS